MVETKGRGMVETNSAQELMTGVETHTTTPIKRSKPTYYLLKSRPTGVET